jgi:hypothetical protein
MAGSNGGASTPTPIQPKTAAEKPALANWRQLAMFSGLLADLVEQHGLMVVPRDEENRVSLSRGAVSSMIDALVTAKGGDESESSS